MSPRVIGTWLAEGEQRRPDDHPMDARPGGTDLVEGHERLIHAGILPGRWRGLLGGRALYTEGPIDRDGRDEHRGA